MNLSIMAKLILKNRFSRILWEVRARVVGKGKFPKTRENLSLVSS
jgi:hypothetical protein